MSSKQKYNRIQLECSLKPFHDMDPAAVTATCEHLFINWERLAERATEIAVLLWIGEGSDIYEWKGDFEQPIVWGNSIGFCNYHEKDAFDLDNRHYRINQAVDYMENPPKLTYAHLKRVISELKRVGTEKTGLPVYVGATLDPGPEFANSSFRFHEHPELLVQDFDRRMPMHFITHQAVMHEDKTAYAGFPDGIPEGTGFGMFLGRQFETYAQSMGFDYIWFSNGFAYTHYPWGMIGEVFKGDHFLTGKAPSELEKLKKFWSDFRAECALPIEVRGSNFTMGMDITTDGCSHEDIFETGKVTRPPTNPPWGSRALGMEMSSYLSRISKTPGDSLPFRFYLNDPWFTTNAWYDYYNRETFDIYAPMAASRLNGDGTVCPPSELYLLTIDTEKGELLRDEANEVTPHFIRALDERADWPSPLVWVYPFDEYHRTLKEHPENLPGMFHHDWFVTHSINAGLPLSTVCNTADYTRLVEEGNWPICTVFAPVPAGPDWAYEKTLIEHLKNGGKLFLYGSLQHASPELLELLDLTLEDELDGEFSIGHSLRLDDFARECNPPTSKDAFSESIGMPSPEPGAKAVPEEERPLRHRKVIDGGGLRAVTDFADPGVIVTAIQDGKKRAYAVVREKDTWNGGKVVWIRSSTSIHYRERTMEAQLDQPWDSRLPAEWTRRLLGEFGMDIIQERMDQSEKCANLFIKRHKGAFYFIGHKPSTSVNIRVKHANGAPVYSECETLIRDGYATETFGKSIYNEVRAFVKMDDGIVMTKELPVPVGKRRHFCIAGLKNATVTIYPDVESMDDGTLHLTDLIQSEDEIVYEVLRDKHVVVVRNYTGAIYVSW